MTKKERFLRELRELMEKYGVRLSVSHYTHCPEYYFEDHDGFITMDIAELIRGDK